MDRDKLLSEDRVRVGALVIGAVRMLRPHGPRILALGVLLAGPLEVAGALAQRGDPDVPQSAAPAGVDALFAVVNTVPVWGDVLVLLLAVPVLAATCALLVTAAVVDRPATVGSALRTALSRAGRLAAVTVGMVALVAVVVGFAALLDAVFPDLFPTGSLGDVVAVLPLTVGLVAVMAVAFVAYPVAALGDAGPADALRSTAQVVRGDAIQILGRAVTVYVVAAAAGSLIQLLAELVVALFATSLVVGMVGETAADVVFVPLFVAGGTLAFLDAQARRSGVEPAALRRELAGAVDRRPVRPGS